MATRHVLSGQDINTILAALRVYQELGYGEPSERPVWVHDIATNDDTDISMDDDGINELCERINCAGEEVDPDAVLSAAAAPGLLAALEIAEGVFNVPEVDPLRAFVAVEKMRAAIARARGQEVRS